MCTYLGVLPALARAGGLWGMIRKTGTGFPQEIMPDEEWKGQHNPSRAKGNAFVWRATAELC
ncbi:MAG: hypothetical protein ACM3OF_11955 [Gemmatimonas sp.]